MHVKIEFTFISYSESVTNHVVSLIFIICAFEIIFIKILHESSTLQELSFLICFDLLDFGMRWMSDFLKSTKTIVR